MSWPGLMMPSNLEKLFLFQCRAYELPEPQQEYRFAAEYVGMGKGVRERLKLAYLKDWRFDFAWPQYMLAVEVEGITKEGGRHQRIGGFNMDLKKYHCAMDMGWTVYRTGHHILKTGESIRLIKKLIEGG